MAETSLAVMPEKANPRARVDFSVLDIVVCTAFLAAGIIGVVIPYVAPGVVPGDVGDARLNRLVLEHFYQVVSGGAESFTNPPLFFPWIDTIALSDTNWGSAPIYALFRILQLDPERAFAAWFATGFILNYLSAYAVFRLFGLRGLGAAAGAFLFSFGLPIISQDGHAQLLYRLCVPWAVWTLYRYFETRDSSLLALTCLLLAFQLLVSFYIGVFLFLLLAAYSVAIFFDRHPFASKASLKESLLALLPEMPLRRSHLVGTAALACGTAALLWIVAAPYLEAARLYHLERPWWEIETMLPRPASYLQATRSYFWSWLQPHLSVIPMAHEHQMFFGLVPLLCVAIALFVRRARAGDPLLRQSLWALLILFVLTLDIQGYTLYVLLTPLPGLSAVRAVTRIVLVMIFPVALIMGRTLDAGWSARSNHPVLGASVLAGCLLLVVESSSIARSTSTIKEWHDRTAALRAETDVPIGSGTILVVANQRSGAFWRRELDAMLLAQSLGATTMNGYSGSVPPGWLPMRTCGELADVIRSATKFRKTHGDPRFTIDTSRMVLIGFGDCRGDLASVRRSH